MWSRWAQGDCGNIFKKFMRFTLNYELICEIKMLVDMILNFTYQTATMRVR